MRTATIGVVLMGLLAWLIYRSRLPGAGLIEYIVMFPQAVPRLVFAFGMMWAWLVFPIPIYGTMWLLLIAYLTVFLPLGVRTIAGVMLQIDKSLEECAQMCGASWGFRMRTVTMPLLLPGLIAAWLLLFIASVRELGASILLMGPHSKVITPSIVESWFGTASELTATLALIQTLVVATAMVVLVLVTRRLGAAAGGLDHAPAKPHIEVENLEIYYGKVPAVRGVSFTVHARRATDAARPLRLRQDHDAARDRRPGASRRAGEIRIDGAPVYSSARKINVPAEKRGLSMVFQSYAIWPHMTVFENVAYGLRVRRDRPRPKSPRRSHQRARHGADARISPTRRASQLSGGQQQRVALARAFVFQPSVLLFDEPLSNLDAKLRADMRIELRELQHRLGITSVYVTHDLEEALAMSDRIVVMRDGLIEQTGTPDEIYSLPRSAFVADFIGSANLIRGRNRPDLAAGGLIALETADGQVMYGMAYGRPAGAELVVSVRTVHLQISRRTPGRRQKCLAGARREDGVSGRLQPGCTSSGATQRLIARCAAMEPIAPGSEVYMTRRAAARGAARGLAFWRRRVVPAEGFEPPTTRLRSGCSTAELRRLAEMLRATDIGAGLAWQAIRREALICA